MYLPWNLQIIAEGHGYPTTEQYVDDINCNSLSIQTERGVAQVVKGEVQSGQKEYDVVDANGQNIEV